MKISKLTSKLVLIALIPAVFASCSRDLSSSTYTDTSTAGLVYQGTIVSARPVTVKSSDKLGEKPGVGTLAGGALGGVGGSMIGKGKGSILSAIGGAVAGAVAGTAAEDALGTSKGVEYIVKLDDASIAQKASNDQNANINLGKKSVGQKVMDSTATGLKSSTISVVQGTDTQLVVGQKVYVIYNDNRPRVVAAPAMAQ